MTDDRPLWAYIAVLRAKLDGANREIRRQRLRADALEPGWSVTWDRRLSRERALTEERDELRRALQPLLDAPYSRVSDRYEAQCVWCLAIERRTYTVGADGPGVDVTDHRPECPVLGRDALLGRTG